jgi:2-C-methyl-D-erythritol 2,4-cyclodiphosphate synthase
MRIGTGYDLHSSRRRTAADSAGVRRASSRSARRPRPDARHRLSRGGPTAVLGAAAAGDNRPLFPGHRRAVEGLPTASRCCRAQVAKVIRRWAIRVPNVDATVIAQKPKLLPHLDAMRAESRRRRSEIDPSAVSVKGKNQRGRRQHGPGESMACHAVAGIKFEAMRSYKSSGLRF